MTVTYGNKKFTVLFQAVDIKTGEPVPGYELSEHAVKQKGTERIERYLKPFGIRIKEKNTDAP